MNFHVDINRTNASSKTISPLLGNHLQKAGRSHKTYSKLKYFFDLAVVIPVFILLAPAMLFVAFLIAKHDGGSALFIQKRIGLNGREFNCYKFRTMVMDAQERLDDVLQNNPVAAAEWARDQKLKNDPRITGLGRFLRKTSLDELPQLLNILKGEMSLVGPRPIVQSEISKYGACFKYYASVKPGVSGLWQISGRNNTTYDERVGFDVTYAQTYSFLNDTKILLKTLPAVLFSKGAY